MKVLYFTNCFPVPGNSTSGIFTYQRVSQLLRKGIEVNVVGYKFTSSRKNYFKFVLNSWVKKNKDTLKSICPLDPRITVSTILELGTDRFPDYMAGTQESMEHIAEKLYGEYKRTGSQLIHVHFLWYAYPAYLLKKKYGIPYVITLHGSDIHETPFTGEHNRKDAVMLMTKADQLIFVSRFLLDKAREFGYKGNNVSVISNGFDDKIFNIENVRKPGSSSVVGFVGHIVEGKGVLLFPEIFHRISKSIPGIQFIMVGEGPEKNVLTDRLNQLGILDKVIFTGKVMPEQVAGYMKRMDVLVLPSFNEGFPCVLVEAQACGVPVVASENGGTPEAVGHTGRIVANGPNYELRFAEAIIELLNKKNDILEVHNSVKESTWSKIVDKEIEVYQNALTRK